MEQRQNGTIQDFFFWEVRGRNYPPSTPPTSAPGSKGVSTVLKAVPIWPTVRYILDTNQYRCIVSGLPLFYIYIYIYMYVCMCVCIYIIINIKFYHKTFPQFRTNYSWFQTLVSIKREKKNRKLKSYHYILRKQIILIS